MSLSNYTNINGDLTLPNLIVSNGIEFPNGDVRLGNQAGSINQAPTAIAIGNNSGQNNQEVGAISIGILAGVNNQKKDAVAIGFTAGSDNQQEDAVAIGRRAGNDFQGSGSVAIGNEAGDTQQGQNCVAIGNKAGFLAQDNNTIILNATGNPLNSDRENATFIAPVRNVASSDILYYNSTSKEVSFAPAPALGVPNLESVLGQGNSAGGFDIDMNANDILNVDNIDVIKNLNVSTINLQPYPPPPPVIPAPPLSSVLTAGNKANTNIDMSGNSLLNLNQINGSVYPPSVPSLSSVLTAGSTANTNINMNNNNLLNVNQINGSSFPPPLSNVLTAGSTANVDINMNGKQLLNVSNLNVSTINNSTYPPTIPPPPAPPLSNVLTAGSIASTDINMNSNNLLNVNNINLSTVNGSAYPPVVPPQPVPALSSVLTAGNKANTNIDMSNNNLLNVNNINLSTINNSAYPFAVNKSLGNVLDVSNVATQDINMNSKNIVGVNNINLSTVNGSAYPPPLPPIPPPSYDVVSFTPVLVGMSADTRQGFYQKIGNMVMGNIQIFGNISFSSSFCSMNAPLSLSTYNFNETPIGGIRYDLGGGVLRYGTFSYQSSPSNSLRFRVIRPSGDLNIIQNLNATTQSSLQVITGTFSFLSND
jgi:hypothetical protein